jgi:CPA2 family monovalent cation:H+ antiporter-2
VTIVAIVEVSLMLWLGHVTGHLFGWTAREALYAGAIVAISSTTIIAKTFDERRVGGRLRELVIGVLIVEDLAAILLLALLTTLSSASGLSARVLAVTAGRLGVFLVGVMVVGLLAVPRAMRAIVRLDRPETTLVAAVGLCFGVSLLAQKLGYSVALGAFLAGSLVAESGEEKRVEKLVEPVRDMFSAIFFVAVGMLIDPVIIARHWTAVLGLTVVVVVGKVVGVTGGAFLTGAGTRTSIQAGMSLAQIGEFSFIIAGLGLSLGATGDFLYPVAIAVSGVTTLLTPWLVRASDPVATWVDRKLPRPVQTFVALYASWLGRLRTERSQAEHSRVRRLVRLLVIDGACLGAILIGTAIELEGLATRLGQLAGFRLARALVLGAAGVLTLPFLVGIYRVVRALGLELATAALPTTEAGKVDLGATPRRALLFVLQVGLAVLVLVPLAALTQPFLPLHQALLVMALLVGVFAVAFWRRAADLHGHVQAGAQVMLEAIASGARDGVAPLDQGGGAVPNVTLMPGLGEPVTLRLEPSSPAAGRTLKQVNLRGMTGAMVIAIRRGEESLVLPAGNEVLRAGDVLVITGTEEAVSAARGLLGSRTAQGLEAAAAN